MAPPLIAAATSPLGSSLIGAGVDYVIDKDQAKKNAKLQKEFAKNQIQWAVADAKKAGIHPLFALGSSINASPSFVSGQSPAGSMIAEGLRGMRKAPADPTQAAQVRALNASAARDEAQAALTLSERKRLEQTVNSQPLLGASGAPGPGLVRPVADPQVSARPGQPSVTAATKPAFMEVELGTYRDGTPMRIKVPWSEEGPAEALDPITWGVISAMKNFGWFDLYDPNRSKAVIEYPHGP